MIGHIRWLYKDSILSSIGADISIVGVAMGDKLVLKDWG